MQRELSVTINTNNPEAISVEVFDGISGYCVTISGDLSGDALRDKIGNEIVSWIENDLEEDRENGR